MGAVEPAPQQQLNLLERRQPSRPVDLTYIPDLQNTNDAIDYACTLAGLAGLRRKEIYLDMEYDPGSWSRVLSGEFDLKGREINRFNRVVGNSAYLLYLIHADGWDLTTLRKVQDDKDRLIAQLQQELAEEKSFNRRLVEHTRGAKGP